MNEELNQIVQNFNFNEIKTRIEDEAKLTKYQKWLSISLHIVNALSIILSVLGETLADKIIYGVIVANILNSILNYELLRAQNNLQFNLKVINQYLQNNNIKQSLFVPEQIVSFKYPTTTPSPTPTNMISV